MYSAARYREIQTETATKEQLLVMLLDAVMKNIRLGVAELEASRRAEATAALTKASDIVVELHSTLDRAKAPELCEQLGEIYRFASLRLVSASLRGDPALALEAERALQPVVDAFKQAVAQVTGGAR
ncbi:MAG: flagellar export chaperone FliS [Myxococcales bacterium]